MSVLKRIQNNVLRVESARMGRSFPSRRVWLRRWAAKVRRWREQDVTEQQIRKELFAAGIEEGGNRL